MDTNPHSMSLSAGEKSSKNIVHRSLLLGLAVIMLLGGYLRVEAAMKTVVPYPIRADALNYFSYAYNLRHHGVYSRTPTFGNAAPDVAPQPDALVTPGYPAMLLPFADAAPTGKMIMNIVLLQALLGSLMIPLVFGISRKFLPGAWPLLPAFLTAISPQLINAGVYVLSETLFSFLLLGAIACMVAQFARPDKKLLPVLGGLLVGFAALTRPTLQYFLPMLFVLVLPLLRRRDAYRQGTWMTIGFLLVMTPWIARNLMTLGVASDPTLTIRTLVHGHYPWMMFDGRPETLGYPYRFDPHIAELTVSVGAAIEGIWTRFLANPIEYATWYLFGKPVAFFSWGDAAANGGIFTYPAAYSPYFDVPVFKASLVLMRITHMAWVILSLLAVVYSFAQRSVLGKASGVQITLRLLACIWLYFLLVHMVGFPISRYSVPLLPVVFMLAAFTLMKAKGWVARKAGA